MFDHDTWRRDIIQRLGGFARNPRQELQLAGAPTLLGYLVTRTLEPFLEAFQQHPVAAVLALAEITRGPGADQIVRRATRMRYQSASQVDRELRANRELRTAVEQLLIELHTLPNARQRLNSTREVWLRTTLEHEIDQFSGEFHQLRRALNDPAWQTRFDALRGLRQRQGRYTPADLVLIHDGLSDSAAHVRAAAARSLGHIAVSPPPLLIKTLVRVALHDCDAETRFAAARALGALREHVISPQLLDYFSASLFDEDGFVRSSAAVVLGQLGEYAGAPLLIQNLTRLLEDTDSYARESAARALGQIGLAAATNDVLIALSRAAERGDINLHEAATDSMTRLREARTDALTLPMSA
jgi:hypothetical protein